MAVGVFNKSVVYFNAGVGLSLLTRAAVLGANLNIIWGEQPRSVQITDFSARDSAIVKCASLVAAEFVSVAYFRGI